MSDDLLPCPFCGGEAYIDGTSWTTRDGKEQSWVTCRKCGTYGPSSAEAIAAWNRRAIPATDAAQPMPPNGWNVMQLGQIGWHVVQEGEGWKITRLFGLEILSRDGDGGAVASDPDAYLSGGAGAAEAPAADAREKALREALENEEQLHIWAQEILEGLGMADVLKIESYDDKIEAHSVIGRGIVEVLRALIGETRT